MTSDDTPPTTTEDPREGFARLARRFLSDPRVAEGTEFARSPGLRVNGKIFVMLLQDELVAKLPAPRVDALTEAGVARRLEMGGRRPLREWARFGVEHGAAWEGLAEEALEFVGTLPESSRRKRSPKAGLDRDG